MRGRLLKNLFAGHVLVIVILGAALTVNILRLDASSMSRVTRLRTGEDRITDVERLHAALALAVAAGRGYIISGDTALLAEVRATQRSCAALVVSLRAAQQADPQDAALLGRVEAALARFAGAQERLFAVRREHPNIDDLARRFEHELLPTRVELDEALDAFSAYEHARLGEVYAQDERERERSRRSALGISLALVLLGLVVKLLLTRSLARTVERERQALEQARRALAARDELLAIVAHDLRNPLGAITMGSTVIQESRDLAAIHGHAHQIEHVALRMERLIRTLLDVACIDAGNFAVDPSPCEVEELVADTVALFGDLAADRSIALRTRVEAKGLPLAADRERVLQVLANLVGNAIKFTPRGGVIELSARVDGDALRFAVRDTGPGIEAGHHPHVFDRYWKQGKAKGSGLGLFICKSIIDAHGGRIWVEDAAGGGAAFCFTLPLEPPPPR